MKKWIFIICLALLVILGFSFNVYYQTTKPLKNANEIAEERAKNEASLVTIEDFNLYNGTETYYVTVGKQKGGNKVVVWVPEKKGKEVIVLNWRDGISKKEALNKLKENDSPTEILGVRLGMEKKAPVWEISYLDQANHLNYFYVDFLKSGDYMKEITDI